VAKEIESNRKDKGTKGKHTITNDC
jgi:hypothetical protein